ncbi:acetylxylan esterase [Streptomyces sp. NPDC056503]|uniref:acetylxylan esterase n=1 Tax=Streptomyces sp. NPDC056503 TaxID=3345842 RepID=UPI003685CD13
MALTDLTLDDCMTYRPDVPAPADFDDFWTRTLALGPVGAPVLRPVDNGLALIDTYDVTVPGFDGQPVRGWLRVPAGTDPDGIGGTGTGGRGLACVVEFLGYGRGRGLPHENLLHPAAGYAHLLMDTRGQGWSAAPGATSDPAPGPSGTVPGFLTRGLDRPEDHYYRRLFADAVRWTEAARALPMVDPDRIVVTGFSQGGGIALAVAGLVPGLAGVMPDVPFLCHIRRGAEIAPEPPYTEIAQYLALHRDRVDRAFTTLSYFDGVHFAARADAPALFSIALMDPVCPPSTCFTAYHRYAGEKSVEVYPFNGHEGGGRVHERLQLAFLRDRVGAPRTTGASVTAAHLPA